MFIDFEGIDGSGKGTLIGMLKDRLEGLGRVVVLGKEPGGTPLGELVRSILFHSIKTQNMAPSVCDCLFLADHIQHVETLVKPALAAGSDVISDRYAFSQFAYGTERVVHPMIEAAYRDLIGVVPDVIVLLVGTPEHQEGKAWNHAGVQARIQDAYLRLLMPYAQTVVVDTDVLPPEALFENYIWPAVEKASGGMGVVGQRCDLSEFVAGILPNPTAARVM
jgi:dTMP kinase